MEIVYYYILAWPQRLRFPPVLSRSPLSARPPLPAAATLRAGVTRMAVRAAVKSGPAVLARSSLASAATLGPGIDFVLRRHDDTSLIALEQ